MTDINVNINKQQTQSTEWIKLTVLKISKQLISTAPTSNLEKDSAITEILVQSVDERLHTKAVHPVAVGYTEDCSILGLVYATLYDATVDLVLDLYDLAKWKFESKSCVYLTC